MKSRQIPLPLLFLLLPLLLLPSVFLKPASAQPPLLWEKTWGGSGEDFGDGVAVDPSSGNIYVTGATNSFGAGGGDVLLLKFDSSGSLLWEKTWGGSNEDQGIGVAVDPSSGNIYVTGGTFSFAAGQQAFLLKFDSSGSLTCPGCWQRTWPGSSSLSFGQSVAVDSSGHVYVGGYTDSFGAGFDDVLLLKFDSSGSLTCPGCWQRTWGGSGSDEGYGVVVDAFSNKVYVAGNTNSFSAGGSCGTFPCRNVLLLGFTSAGTFVEDETWGGGSHSGGDFGHGVAVGGGGLLVTGYVSEGPPYVLASPIGTLGFPAFSLGSPAFSLGTPTFALQTPPGTTVLIPDGSQVYAGSSDVFLLNYGLPFPISFLPTFNSNVQCIPCLIIFNGTSFTYGQSGNFTYGSYPISAQAPAGYTFTSWNATGGITVASPTTNATTATITGPGTLTANFSPPSSGLYPAGVLLAALIITTTFSSITLKMKRRSRRG